MATSATDDALVFLRNLAEATSTELWRIARKEITSSRLVLPNYRNGKRRVSEQEARSVAQRLVAESNYFFSIETPTDTTHRFSGDQQLPGRSAQHDLSFYTSPDPSSIVAHAEFKQGHKSGVTGVNVIAKDLIKLIESRRHCLWFHSFSRPTSNEFSKLGGFFRDGMSAALLGRTPSVTAKVVLALCSVVEPSAWIAGPITWSELVETIAAFPIVSPTPHHSWTSLPVAPDVKESPAANELEFVNLKEPNGEEESSANA